MISFRGYTWILLIALCTLICWAAYRNPEIIGRLILCAVGVFTITAVTAAFLRRSK